MRKHALKALCAACLAVMVVAACGDSNLINDPSFDLWCGDSLCSWQTDEGHVKRVGTWNKGDYAASFVATPTQISQLSEEDPVPCILFDTIADVDPEARLVLQLDFNDDGKIELEQTIPAVRWKSVEFSVQTPPAYDRVRFILRKRGTGKAVLAQIRAVGRQQNCGEPLLLADGSKCSADESCASTLCAGNVCAACATGPTQVDKGPSRCEEGAECRSAAHCAEGACLGHTCRACAADGSCEPESFCEADAHCGSGLCLDNFRPSSVDAPFACGACEHDRDCSEGPCVEGRCQQCGVGPLGKTCAACRSDADCDAAFCTFGSCSSCRTGADCEAGEVCAAEDAFDMGPLSCRAESTAPLPRGALCTATSPCEGELVCGSAAGEPARCGIGCETDPGVCGVDAVCLRPAVARSPGTPSQEAPWSDVASRVATCYPRVHVDAADLSCLENVQCDTFVCCEGSCLDTSSGAPIPDACAGDAWVAAVLSQLRDAGTP